MDSRTKDKQEKVDASSSTENSNGSGKNESNVGDNANDNHENVSSNTNDRNRDTHNGDQSDKKVDDQSHEEDVTLKNKEIFDLFNDRDRLSKLSIEERGNFYETFQMMSRFFTEGGYSCNANGLNNEGPKKVSTKRNLFPSQYSSEVSSDREQLKDKGSHFLFEPYVTPKKPSNETGNAGHNNKFSDIFQSLNQNTEFAGQMVDIGKSKVRYMSSKEADIFPTFNGNTIQQLHNWVGQFEKHAHKFYGDNNFRWVFEMKRKIDHPLLSLIENIDTSEIDYCSFVERLIVIVRSMNVAIESSPYERFSSAKLLEKEKLLAYANRLQHLYELTCPNNRDTETSQMLKDKFLGTIPEIIRKDIENRIISVEAFTESRVTWSQLVRQLTPCTTALGSDNIDSMLLGYTKKGYGGGSGSATISKERVHFESSTDANVFMPGKMAPKKCRHCFRRNHDSSECRINNNSCFKCGSGSHFIANCPMNKEIEKKENARVTTEDNNLVNKVSSYDCFTHSNRYFDAMGNHKRKYDTQNNIRQENLALRKKAKQGLNNQWNIDSDGFIKVNNQSKQKKKSKYVDKPYTNLISYDKLHYKKREESVSENKNERKNSISKGKSEQNESKTNVSKFMRDISKSNDAEWLKEFESLNEEYLKVLKTSSASKKKFRADSCRVSSELFHAVDFSNPEAEINSANVNLVLPYNCKLGKSRKFFQILEKDSLHYAFNDSEVSIKKPRRLKKFLARVDGSVSVKGAKNWSDEKMLEYGKELIDEIDTCQKEAIGKATEITTKQVSLTPNTPSTNGVGLVANESASDVENDIVVDESGNKKEKKNKKIDLKNESENGSTVQSADNIDTKFKNISTNNSVNSDNLNVSSTISSDTVENKISPTMILNALSTNTVRFCSDVTKSMNVSLLSDVGHKNDSRPHIFEIFVTVGGKTFIALIDSGSSENSVRLDLIKELGLELIEADPSVHVTHTRSLAGLITIQGYVHISPIMHDLEFPSTMCKVNPFSKNEYQIVLGARFINENKLILDGRNLSVTKLQPNGLSWTLFCNTKKKQCRRILQNIDVVTAEKCNITTTRGKCSYVDVKVKFENSNFNFVKEIVCYCENNKIRNLNDQVIVSSNFDNSCIVNFDCISTFGNPIVALSLKPERDELYCIDHEVILELPEGTYVGKASSMLDYGFDSDNIGYCHEVEKVKNEQENNLNVQVRVSYRPQPEELSDADRTLPELTSWSVEGLNNELIIKTEDMTIVKEVRDLMWAYRDVASETEGSPPTKLSPMKIMLKDTTPVCLAPYPISPQLAEEAEKLCLQLEEKGVIEKAVSNWNSPLLLIKKPNNRFRLTLDLRKVNEKILGDSYSLPNINQVLTQINGFTVFSKFDLSNGFFLQTLHPDSRFVTAFTSPRNSWVFKRTVQGLKTSPAGFSRAVREAFGSLLDPLYLMEDGKIFSVKEGDELVKTGVKITPRIYLFQYIDDLLIGTITEAQHMTVLKLVLEKLREYNLKIQIKKCEFFCSETVYLGHVLSSGGKIRKCPNYVKSILDIERPTTIGGLGKFVGAVIWLSKFTPNLSTLLRPLTEKTSSSRATMRKKLIWTSLMTESFDKVKIALAEKTELSSIDESEDANPLVLMTDASQVGCGAIICQKIGQEQCVIGYYSSSFSQTECNYSATNRELLAIKKSLNHFRNVLIGRKFLLLVDHGSLIYLQNFRNVDSRLQRLFEMINLFDFIIMHIPGKNLTLPDMLSRIDYDKLMKECQTSDFSHNYVPNFVTPMLFNPKGGANSLFSVLNYFLICQELNVAKLKPSQYPLEDRNLTLRRELHHEIVTHAERYHLPKGREHSKEWKTYALAGRMVPLEFLNAFCNLYKCRIDCYIGDEVPLTYVCQTEVDGEMPVLVMQLIDWVHYTLASYTDDYVPEENIIRNMSLNDFHCSVEHKQFFDKSDREEEIDSVISEEKSIVRMTAEDNNEYYRPSCNHRITNDAVIPIKFEGYKETYCGLVDTGCSLSILQESLAKRLLNDGKLIETEKASLVLDCAGGLELKVNVWFAKTSCELGKMSIKEVNFCILPDSRMPHCLLIGMDLINKYGFILDYEEMALKWDNEIMCDLGRMKNNKEGRNLLEAAVKTGSDEEEKRKDCLHENRQERELTTPSDENEAAIERKDGTVQCPIGQRMDYETKTTNTASNEDTEKEEKGLQMMQLQEWKNNLNEYLEEAKTWIKTLTKITENDRKQIIFLNDMFVSIAKFVNLPTEEIPQVTFDNYKVTLGYLGGKCDNLEKFCSKVPYIPQQLVKDNGTGTIRVSSDAKNDGATPTVPIIIDQTTPEVNVLEPQVNIQKKKKQEETNEERNSRENVLKNATFDAVTLNYILLIELQNMQKNDPSIILLKRCIQHNIPWPNELKSFFNSKGKMYIVNDTVCFYNKMVKKLVPVVPFKFLVHIAITTHTANMHIGSNKLIFKLKDIFYHPSLFKVCRELTSSCGLCQMRKYSSQQKAPPMLKIVEKTPMKLVQMDCLHLVGSFGFNYCLVFMDIASKWCHCIPLRTKSGTSVADAFENRILPTLIEMPKAMHVDNGIEFRSVEFTTMLEKYGIQHIKSTPFRSMGHGGIERSIKTLTELMRVECEKPSDWLKHVGKSVFTYNHSIHRETGKTPAQYLYEEAHTPTSPLQVGTKETECWKLGHPNFMRFQMNQIVVKKVTHIGIRTWHKLSGLFMGPFKIVERGRVTYKIQSCADPNIIIPCHHDQIKAWKVPSSYIRNHHTYKEKLQRFEPKVTAEVIENLDAEETEDIDNVSEERTIESDSAEDEIESIGSSSDDDTTESNYSQDKDFEIIIDGCQNNIKGILKSNVSNNSYDKKDGYMSDSSDDIAFIEITEQSPITTESPYLTINRETPLKWVTENEKEKDNWHKFVEDFVENSARKRRLTMYGKLQQSLDIWSGRQKKRLSDKLMSKVATEGGEGSVQDDSFIQLLDNDLSFNNNTIDLTLFSRLDVEEEDTDMLELIRILENPQEREVTQHQVIETQLEKRNSEDLIIIMGEAPLRTFQKNVSQILKNPEGTSTLFVEVTKFGMGRMEKIDKNIGKIKSFL